MIGRGLVGADESGELVLAEGGLAARVISESRGCAAETEVGGFIAYVALRSGGIARMSDGVGARAWTVRYGSDDVCCVGTIVRREFRLMLDGDGDGGRRVGEKGEVGALGDGGVGEDDVAGFIVEPLRQRENSESESGSNCDDDEAD